MTLGDRIVIMRDGYVQQIGTPQDVFNRPANLFVAGFIGMPQMNFFDAHLVRVGNEFHVETEHMSFDLSLKRQIFWLSLGGCSCNRRYGGYSSRANYSHRQRRNNRIPGRY